MMQEDRKRHLVRLIEQVQTMSACIADMDAVMNRIESISGNTEIGRWIFDPPNGKKMTAEQIVDEISRGDSKED
ncbi:MAG: hypothetical protein AAF623_07390 [Planctomycetota bacterium]